MSSAIILSGTIANYGEIESSGMAKIKFAEGRHIRHIAEYRTEKANCGASWEIVNCECGAEYHSAANGCCQDGHQWDAHGDETLSPEFISNEILDNTN